MKILKKIKKWLYITIVILITYVIFCIVFFKINGHLWQLNLYNLKWNLSNQSKFETKNFIIDLPKLNWIGETKENGELFFYGTFIYFDGFDMNNGSAPSLFILDFNESLVDMWESDMCDISFEKSTNKINNFEVKIYDCESSKIKCSVSKFIVYQDEGFFIYGYDDRFKPQYDKFFEGVRLKE